MNIVIRSAKTSDLKEYTNLLQYTYQNTYIEDSLGLTKNCFSMEVFLTPATQKYLRSNLVISDKQKTWLGFNDQRMIGSITIEDKGNECELRGFYIHPEHQGKGIGKQLWLKAFHFSQGKDIILDIYSHNKKTIEIYKRWGFVEDVDKGRFYRHWPEWPEGVKAECLYMRYKGKKR